MGSLHDCVIGGQGPKSGVHSWRKYWGPGPERWGPFMGELLGARGREVEFVQGGIIGGQGLKSGAHSRGYYSGPGPKVRPIQGGIIGGQGPKSRSMHSHRIHLWGPYWGPGAKKCDKFMKALLGARGRKVGLIRRGIVGVLL